MSSQRCADITAEAHLSTMPTEGPTTCCGPQVWVQRGTHEIHPTQSGHPDPDSSQLSFTCTTNTSKPYRRSLHSSSPSVIQDSLFNTHTYPKSPLQHATNSTCWQTNPTYKWAKKQLVWLPTFLKGMDSPGVQSEKQTLSHVSPFFQVGMSMARRGRIRGPEKYCYLYPVFWQLCLHGQHLSSIHIRVVSLIEGLFQLLQLVGCEDCPERNKTLWPKNITCSKGNTESEKWTQMLQKPE